MEAAGPNSDSCAASLSQTVGFELLGGELGSDVESALRAALSEGAVFPSGTDPLSIFRESLAASIRNFESHPKGKLFQEFLLKGPYEGEGEVPVELSDQRLSDEETTEVIAFIYAHMVNSFKGAITELLASAPCLSVLKRLQRDEELPSDARLYVGDVVGLTRAKGKGYAKGADAHVLILRSTPDEPRCVILGGVAEVKSYFASERRLRGQLDKHLARAKNGLRVAGVDYPAEHVRVGYGKRRTVIRLMVLPHDWKLPRTFHFEPSAHGRSLHADPAAPPEKDNRITRLGDDEWQITLRWSKEALAAAAYEMTFWYMEKVGEFIYAQGVPKEWSEMTRAEAGRNAAKMMLYYAMLRCCTNRENQRAIALYNSYSFGYALGMNFKNARGRREMLWPKDLDEILAFGKTKYGCRIAK